MTKFTKHGLVCLSLPARLFFMDLTICVDISKNPGPVREIAETLNSTSSLTSRPSGIQTQKLHYTRSELISLKKHWSMGVNTILSLKDVGLFRSRGVKAGRRVHLKNQQNRPISVIDSSKILCINSLTKSTCINCPWHLCNGAIPVRITERGMRSVRRHACLTNCIPVPVTARTNKENNRHPTTRRSMLPSFVLIDIRSLFPKVDELTAFLATKPTDIVAITESWLHKDIDDNLISINGYNIYRNDRSVGRGGGVCVYLAQHIPSKRRTDLENPNFECLWLWIRPTRLPRPLSGIAVAILYNPPDRSAQEIRDLNEYLITTIDFIRNRYPDCGIVILGDFNNFDVSNLTSNHTLKQVVHLPTRGSAILDLIVTNLHNLYEKTCNLAPLGSCDHNIVQWLPNYQNIGSKSQVKPIKRLVRRYPQSGIDAFGRWVSTHDWYGELGPDPSADELAVSFTSQLTSALDRIFPLKTLRHHQSDKPWITPAIKLLINDRQKAFHNGNLPLWQSLKYKVQEKIAARKKSFYKNKVQHLKKDDCRKWWKIVNRISGKSDKTSCLSLERDGRTLSNVELANTLNELFVSVNADIPPLNVTTLPSFLPAEDYPPTIQPYEVCKKLLAVQPFKAHGPDNVPSRILKEFAFELAEPVTTIFNTSLISGVVPVIWKDSNITPIPKTQQPTCEGDIRPISLTPCLSKVLEDFVVSWMIFDVNDKIDPSQFGCPPPFAF